MYSAFVFGYLCVRCGRGVIHLMCVVDEAGQISNVPMSFLWRSRLLGALYRVSITHVGLGL